MDNTNDFDKKLEHLRHDEWRGPLVDVADTMEICLLWFRAQKIEPTADALVAMARLVIERKREIDAENDRLVKEGLSHDDEN